MTEPTMTVDGSLELLVDVLGKAADDFRAAATILARARADIAAHNTAVSRTVISAARRAVDHLRGSDEALRDVLKSLEARD